MLNNIIYFAFQSIFIFYGILNTLTYIVSYFYGSKISLIFLVALLFNILIVYFINFLKKNVIINRISFIYYSIAGWFLIILVSSIPFFELLILSSLNEIIFFTTSLVTSTGFNLETTYSNDKFILSMWVSIVQNIGALYTLLLFFIYCTLFINNNLIILSKKNIIKLYIIFLIFLTSFTLIFLFDNYNFFLSFSIASSILSSTGLKVFNSVFLSYDTNYFIIIMMMLSSLLVFPLAIIFANKSSFKFMTKFLKKNRLNLSFFIILVMSSFFLFFDINLDAFKKLCFIVSFITTTGILPAEFEDQIILSSLNKYLFLIIFISIIGSFSGTTNGGLKINKLSLFFINFKEELNKFLFENNIKGVNIIKKGYSQNQLNTFYSLIILSLMLIIFSLLIFNISGASFKISLIYIIASLTSTGEAFLIISNINEKIKTEYYFLLDILMICGRYEFIGYLLVFNKIFKWRKLI